MLIDTIFVGSEYHKKKLLSANKLWKNTKVTYLPFPPINPSTIKEKKYDIISVSRPTTQKVDLFLESEVLKEFGQINRPISNSWEDYFDNLAMSKILLITAHEETFGYQIVDAIMNNCIPLARNDLSYPELLSLEYLYNDKNELLEKIHYILNGDVSIPKLLCETEMNNFYINIIEEMEN